MFADPSHVCRHALRLTLDREPVDVVTIRRSRPRADIVKAVRRECSRLQALGQKAPHRFVGEVLLTAAGMVNHEPFTRALQLVRNDQGPNRIIAGSATRVADDVRVSFCQAGKFCWIETRVHAGQHRKVTGRRHGQICLVAKAGGIAGIRRQNFVDDLAHV